MICTYLRLWLLIVSVLLFNASAISQVDKGTPPFSSTGGGPFDVIDLANLNVHFEIPVVSKAGRGIPFVYNLPYDSSVWYPAGTSGNQTWAHALNFGWPAQTEIATGSVTIGRIINTWCFDPDFGKVYYTATTFRAFTDASGVRHPFFLSVVDNDYCGGNIEASALSSDGSGYTLYADGISQTASATSRTGWGVFPPQGGPGQLSDTNGNYITVNSSNGTFTDTLGKTVMTVTGTGSATSPLNFAYTNPGGTASSVAVNYTNFNIKTNFGCSGISEYTGLGVPLATSIVMPDQSSYTIAYETTSGYSGYYTGRIHSITLPTGGQIQYDYTGPNNGIVCADGSTSGLTRTVTPGGDWTYTRTQVSGAQWTTKITDPQDNDTLFNFQGLYETSRQSFQGAVSGGTLLQTLATCYNGNTGSCDTTAVTAPITQRAVTLQLPGGKQSKTVATYSSDYGVLTDLKEYDFGDGAPPSNWTRHTAISYAPLGGIGDHPSSITVSDANGIQAQTSYTYDEGTPTPTTGTPQHTGASTRGNLTTITSTVKLVPSKTLTRHFSYYDTGNVKTTTDVNNAVTTYVYGSASCGNSFVTEVDLPITTLKRYVSWDSPNCTGAVVKSETDENGKSTTYDYTDPNYWRVTKITDPLSNYTTISYPNVNTVESSLSFGSTSVDVRSTVDGFGRSILAQQLNTGSTYDSFQTNYNSVGQLSKTLLPFSSGAGVLCSGTCPGTTFSYDPLGRSTLVSDAGGGDVSYNYAPASSNNNVVLSALEPAPPGTSENTKQRQLQTDGLGRLSSVCEMTTGSGSGTCSQTVTQTGYFTQYTYDVLGHIVGVSQNAQSAHPQGRSFAYDMLGRMTSETNPENGTTNYTYDSATGCTGTYNGDLVKRVDAQGNTTCYAYDSLHRVTTITYSGPYGSSTPTKNFVYDSATVNGVAMANAKGRLAEAYTGPSSPKTTDLGFSYSARGELVDVYESTPHSSGYYHVAASYWPNGVPNTIQNLAGLPTITYGLDSEGRTKTVSASSGVNPVSNTVYNTTSQVTEVDFGSSDKDTFQYDSNTGRMTQYKFFVGSNNVTGNLTWNTNGTLKTLAITDGLNSSDTQTCNYGYDDLARITSANCGSVWNQTFAFDPFGNISKSGSSSFQAGYLLADGSTNNRVQSLPGATVTYDSNGNLTGDGTHTATWDAEGNPVQLDAKTITYDALGRMVEFGSTNTAVVYSPTGSKLALMSGQSLTKAFVPLPGGATVVYTPSGIAYYRHADWLGSSRVASTPSRTKYYDVAYAAYGESYTGSGTTDLSFTGQNTDVVAGFYDFMFRKYNPVHGRWISPDPAGLLAVELVNPQTWNRCAFVANNPLSYIDPLGLQDTAPGWDPHPNACTAAADAKFRNAVRKAGSEASTDLLVGAAAASIFGAMGKFVKGAGGKAIVGEAAAPFGLFAIAGALAGSSVGQSRTFSAIAEQHQADLAACHTPLVPSHANTLEGGKSGAGGGGGGGGGGGSTGGGGGCTCVTLHYWEEGVVFRTVTYCFC